MLVVALTLLLLAAASIGKLSSSLEGYQLSRERKATAESEQGRVEEWLNSAREAYHKKTHTVFAEGQQSSGAVRRIVLTGESDSGPEESIFSGERSSFGVLSQE